MAEFRQIYEFIITMLLVWSLLCLASSLLLFQSQLVRLITRNGTQSFWLISWCNLSQINIYDSKVSTRNESGRVDIHIDYHMRFDRIISVLLWIWRNDQQPVWLVCYGTFSMQLVCVSNWNAKMPADIHDKHTATGSFSRIWRYWMYSWSFQSGKLHFRVQYLNCYLII